MYGNKKLNLVVDMYGCPNRCLHCWLGHMPNKRMEDGADRLIMDYFSPFFDRIAFYSWMREPDYCSDYQARWAKDVALSKNTVPERFELASFYRIVRDDAYIPFLKSVGVKKVQLTFFGMKATQDRYVGRKGAYEEVMLASDLLTDSGIIPRWQCFINEENADEIVRLYRLAQAKRKQNCPSLEFFVHEGSCEGENRKLYPIRIRKRRIPDELIPVFLNYADLLTEGECCKILREDVSHPSFPIGDTITLNISNEYDVYYNFTHLSKPWIIGNLKTENPEALVRKIVSGDTSALQAAKKCVWAELANQFGDASSEKVFSLEDYKMFLFNRYLEQC